MNLLKNAKISRLTASQFTFERWRAGSLTELNIYTKYYSIEENAHVIRSHTVGFIKAEKLWVRPKLNCVAVMFFVNDQHFWTHLTIKEFLSCYPELKKEFKSLKK